MQLEKLQYKLYQEHFDISNKKTLCLVAFALGPYTAGVLTSKLSWPINLYNNFSVVSIGMNRDILLSLINELKDNYDQIIIIGYPPFIVDFIEYVEDKDISIKDIGLKIMYTSERVSESLRNLIASKISSSSNRYDVVGFYACSDAGIIGYETKSIIKLLDRIKDNKKFNIKTFGSIDPPTLVKLDLDSGKYIESVNGEIVITTDQPVPLIRYAIKDRGGVMTGAELKKRLESFCIDFSDLQIHDYYVFVLGRADAVKLTANIYIDDIKYCLEKSIYSNRLSKNFKYGLIKSSNLRNKLKIIVYYKDSSEGFTKKEQEYFAKDFYTNLENSNQDYKVIKEGLKLESFEFSFEKDNNYKFQDSKLKYFL
jgi:phenylacetate-CoA ligase